jgi:iron complex outermembrane receptor protein
MKATHELGFNVAGTVGNFDREEFNGGVTVPIIADVLSVRGSYESSEFDGSWKNNHPNTYAGINPGTNGNVGGWDNETYSVDVLFTPAGKPDPERQLLRLRAPRGSPRRSLAQHRAGHR